HVCLNDEFTPCPGCGRRGIPYNDASDGDDNHEKDDETDYKTRSPLSFSVMSSSLQPSVGS
ncbi:unnamed protein product, partial [Effrenium voratum]